jgi:hypothetical protein
MIIEKGVLAWQFVEADSTQDSEYESNAAIMDDPYTIVFCQGQGSIMTNLPVPIQELSYWEVKVLQLHEEDSVAIGFATKPYPRWRLPGWHKHSIAYHSNSGAVFISDPTYGRPYGPPIKEGDVVGVGYLFQSGTVFFTKNGQVNYFFLSDYLLLIYLFFYSYYTELGQGFNRLQVSYLSYNRGFWPMSCTC